MNFIRPRNLQLLERAIGTRKELRAFVLLITVWGVLLGVAANTLFEGLRKSLGAWVAAKPTLAAIVFVVVFALLFYLGLLSLTWGLSGTMGEVRRFKIVLPVMARSDGVDALGVRGYQILDAVANRLNQSEGALSESYHAALAEHQGRPFRASLHQTLAAALAAEMASSVADKCKFLLSEDADFHGVDYSGLADPPGPCDQKVIEGATLKGRIYLPPGCTAQLVTSRPDHYGKVAKDLLIQGPFGCLRFGVWPQWAILSERYHAKSLQLARARLETEIRNYSERDPRRPPTLWVLEIPAELRVDFSNLRTPWFFLSKRFELYTEWISELMDMLEDTWSWERFVERLPDSAMPPQEQ